MSWYHNYEFVFTWQRKSDYHQMRFEAQETLLRNNRYFTKSKLWVITIFELPWLHEIWLEVYLFGANLISEVFHLLLYDSSEDTFIWFYSQDHDKNPQFDTSYIRFGLIRLFFSVIRTSPSFTTIMHIWKLYVYTLVANQI